MPSKCAFCEGEGAHRCRWWREQDLSTDPHDVRHGDVLVHPAKGVGGRIFEIDADDPLIFKFHMRVLDTGSAPKRLLGTEPWVWAYAPTRVRIRKLAPCSTRCCDLHARELANDHHVCMSCWPLQLAAIKGKEA